MFCIRKKGRFPLRNRLFYCHLFLYNEYVYLKVRDTGIGIAKEDYDRIFERFYRVDKARSKLVGGTGLGLSIVKHACIVNDATIEVDSVLEKGSTFTVKFRHL